MNRPLNVLATAGTLALAGYAVVQLVLDVRELRRWDVAIAGAGAPPSRVLTWDEALAQESAYRAAEEARRVLAQAAPVRPGRRW